MLDLFFCSDPFFFFQSGCKTHEQLPGGEMMKIGMKILMPLVFFTILLSFSARVEAANPREELQQMVEELQQSPNDTALREKIIRHALGMKPAPAVSEEAERHMARGVAAMKGAANERDFKDAAAEFEKAALAAPWYADAYYNLGVSQDKAGMHAEAIRSLKLYLLSAPDSQDVKETKNLIYEIEYRLEKAAKENSPEEVAKRKKDKALALLNSLNGARFEKEYDLGGYRNAAIIEIHGNQVTFGEVYTYCAPWACSEFPVGKWHVRRRANIGISEREQEFTLDDIDKDKYRILLVGFSVSDNGEVLTLFEEWSNTRKRLEPEQILYRKR
jgi:tetratricopeptide (TPR) repeat protein